MSSEGKIKKKSTKIINDGSAPKKKVDVDEGLMAEAFKSVAEFIAFSSEQLLELLDLFPGKFPITDLFRT